jgi:hypothetical protein
MMGRLNHDQGRLFYSCPGIAPRVGARIADGASVAQGILEFPYPLFGLALARSSAHFASDQSNGLTCGIVMATQTCACRGPRDHLGRICPRDGARPS